MPMHWRAGSACWKLKNYTAHPVISVRSILENITAHRPQLNFLGRLLLVELHGHRSSRWRHLVGACYTQFDGYIMHVEALWSLLTAASNYRPRLVTCFPYKLTQLKVVIGRRLRLGLSLERRSHSHSQPDRTFHDTAF
jgi:hypothetical protein